MPNSVRVPNGNHRRIALPAYRLSGHVVRDVQGNPCMTLAYIIPVRAGFQILLDEHAQRGRYRWIHDRNKTGGTEIRAAEPCANPSLRVRVRNVENPIRASDE